MKIWPGLKDSSLTAIAAALHDMIRLRKEDVEEFNNLEEIFMRGRKVDKVPANSSDVNENDNLGDFNYSASFIYILVDNTGASVWRRVAISSF